MTVPIGTIMAYGGLVEGNAKGQLQNQGWLVCDGETVSRNTYHELFDVIGDFFGHGDKIRTFNLPDLRGRFLRGVDAGTNRDLAAEFRSPCNSGGKSGNHVGSVQEDQANSIGSFETKNYHTEGTDFGKATVPENGTPSNVVVPGGYWGAWCGLQISKKGVETRPKNIYVNYIIKAKNVQ